VGHLSDRKFCQPDAEEVAAAEARKKKEELDREIEKVKKEYEEKQRLKREKRKGKDEDKSEDARKKGDEEDKIEEKAKDAKVRLFLSCYNAALTLKEQIEQLSKSKDQLQSDLGPRIYSLNKYVYIIAPPRIAVSLSNGHPSRRLRSADVPCR
jgi:magnesium-transporting ATPase (P-type)